MLLLHGSDIPHELFNELSIQFECFLTEVDRGTADNGDARFRWVTVDPTFQGGRVVVAPERMARDGAHRVVSRILEQARRGISLVGGSSRRPPGFTETALKHLEEIASVVGRPEVSRVDFYTNRMTEPISRSTLLNLGRINS